MQLFIFVASVASCLYMLCILVCCFHLVLASLDATWSFNALYGTLLVCMSKYMLCVECYFIVLLHAHHNSPTQQKIEGSDTRYLQSFIRDMCHKYSNDTNYLQYSQEYGYINSIVECPIYITYITVQCCYNRVQSNLSQYYTQHFDNSSRT